MMDDSRKLPQPTMTREEFTRAYAARKIRVQIDARRAAQYVSQRLWLPLVRLPILGGGVALALIRHWWLGLALFLLGLALPWIIKRTAPNFVLTQTFQDDETYRDAVQREIIRITPVE
jgi:hypothetical protein